MKDYCDDLILSPTAIKKIAKEYSKNSACPCNTLSESSRRLLAQNIELLDGLFTYFKNSPQLQKLAIQSFALCKTNTLSHKNYKHTFKLSANKAKAQCISNTLQILQQIINNFEHIIPHTQKQAINVCLATIEELTQIY
ncbi:MAG: hypothetical protein IJ318_03475 [Clostridia bacterium]|nr:hypothetical protein [Clostridia bacterium]